eukprot:COSAG02_NODE_46569_length_347_cov_6.302419_1_plen_24_part_01
MPGLSELEKKMRPGVLTGGKLRGG